MKDNSATHFAQRVAFALFLFSGFAGIIYESIWSHYLKLFLGHAAYAQTIVLVMFMGGMAIGAALAVRIGKTKWDLLRIYAAVECLIGIGGLAFPGIYPSAVEFVYTAVLPGIDSELLTALLKNTTAAILILPQSVLLGMTFPLMTVGFMRRSRLNEGESVAALYFFNSFGAAIGVLIAGFVFLKWFGLPGTIRTAAYINFAVAFAVLFLLRSLPPARQTRNERHGATNKSDSPRLLLYVALFTGTASFIYEIVWIRMLSMVLGSSTHSFELMLSAFIIGLAIGSYWIRRTIATIKRPLLVLGLIQVAMAVLAITTLMFYDFSFDLMAAAIVALSKTPIGYAAFLLFSHSIALLIMLPATICAGMTLPLATQVLMDTPYGERSVGAIYAANTIGAIFGVIATVHILIPVLGLKYALIMGAIIDAVIGLILIARFKTQSDGQIIPALVIVLVAYFSGTMLFVEIDPRKTAAGVFRTGIPEIGEEAKIAWRRDGKTASITLTDINDSLRVIATNGKPDASIEMNPALPPSRDERTQVLTGVLPTLIHPEAKTAALIGMGSGMSTHALLASPTYTRVDTIEIEAAMVEGAKQFNSKVARAFNDHRSHVVINDGRSYFASRSSPYDIIISEPSNPWVSGVSGLFSSEFYRLASRQLADGGVFVQWLQLYEIDVTLVASVFKALNNVFPHFRVYNTDTGNILILAAKDRPLPDPADSLAQAPFFQTMLARLDINSPEDLRIRFIGDERLLMPLFNSYRIAPNSDYFPVLDIGSAMQRYMNTNAKSIAALTAAEVPLQEIIGGHGLAVMALSVDGDLPAAERLRDAYALSDLITDPASATETNLSDALRHLVSASLESPLHCSEQEQQYRRRNFVQLASRVVGYVDADIAMSVLTKIQTQLCTRDQSWYEMFRAFASRDGAALAMIGSELIAGAGTEIEHPVLLKMTMFGNLLENNRKANLELWDTLAIKERAHLPDDLTVRLLLAHSGWRDESTLD